MPAQPYAAPVIQACSPLSPSVVQPTAPALMVPAPLPAPCAPIMAAPPQSMGTVMMPPAPAVSQSPPPPCGAQMAVMQQSCIPSESLLRQSSGVGCCLHGGPLPEAPVLQEVRPVKGNSSALSVQWTIADNLAAGFSVELRESGAKCSERFMRSASGFAGTLELCIGGLNPGLSYMACVYAVSSCGCESTASRCSQWVTLPGEIKAESKDIIRQFEEPLDSNLSAKQVELLDPENPPPEVTGHENETLLLD